MTTSAAAALASDAAAASVARRARIESIDLVRGAVMAVMLLDHARDFLHRGGLTVDPTDLATTTKALFTTRWITHFCAPVFVFLAGTSARLREQRGGSKPGVSRFLASRGLFLVALELIVLRPAIWFDLDYSLAAHLQVIWVIGWSMIVLAVLVRFPLAVSLAFGLTLVLGHNLLDRFQVGWPARTPGEIVWALLHVRTGVQLGAGVFAFVQYPLIPWVGVMALGYAFGELYALDAPRRRCSIAAIGAATVALFVVLRATNLYGDPRPWAVQENASFTLMSFVNTEKYPPSLLFLCMTLGPALLALAALDGRSPGRAARPLIVLGGVPLFFYVLQWPSVHLLAWLFQWVAGQPIGWDALNPLTLGSELPEGLGFSLPAVYLAWALGLVALYPPCAWYARLKKRRRDLALLSYL